MPTKQAKLLTISKLAKGQYENDSSYERTAYIRIRNEMAELRK